MVSTWGSSPRPVGSQLGVSERGEMVGSVSGGCIEGAVVKEALEVMAGAPPKLIDYGVSNEQAWEVGLACGGKLEVYIEPVTERRAERDPDVRRALLERLLEARAAKQPAAHLRWLERGDEALVVAGEAVHRPAAAPLPCSTRSARRTGATKARRSRPTTADCSSRSSTRRCA